MNAQFKESLNYDCTCSNIRQGLFVEDQEHQYGYDVNHENLDSLSQGNGLETEKMSFV